VVFFFQAEDGIRDKLVTGVQTCALPIYVRAARTHGGEGRVARRVDESDFRSLVLHAVRPDVLRDPARFAGRDARLANRVQERGRSEERRVGKEGSYRWWRWHQEIKADGR